MRGIFQKLFVAASLTLLPSVLFGATAHDWLASQQSANGFVDSFESDGSTVAYTYDQALAVIAFTCEGDIVRARRLLDRLAAVQNTEGSWDDAYYSDSGAPTSTWRVTGNSIWVVMAINYYTIRTGDTAYVNNAKRCADWFLTLQEMNPGDVKYGSISGGLSDVGGRIVWTSTEHNQDAYSALKYLGQILNDPYYTNRATLVYNWITRKMWDNASGHFYVGLGDMAGNINYGEYMDIQAWGISALGVTGPAGEDYRRGMAWASRMRLTRSWNGQNIDGYDYDGTVTGGGGGVWFEGTGQMSVAFEVMNDSANSNYFFTQIGKAQSPNGGIICAVGDGGIAWPTHFPINCAASTSWYIFASQAPKVNPFAPVAVADGSPPTSSGVTASSITPNSATITWTTNENSDSQVEYGFNTSYGSSTALDSSMVINHSVPLSNLAAGALYHYRVKSRDAAGNLSVSGDFTFTTAGGGDVTPPTISTVGSSSITPTSAAISWITDENSDSQVDYGTTTAYGSLVAAGSMLTSHNVSLVNLAPQTIYHYRVRSRDATGNTALSGDFTFTTPALPDTTPPSLSNIAASNISAGGATVTWATNEAADSQVEYGLTAAYGSSTALDSVLAVNHSVNLAGLSASTVYHYRVKSKDAAGNLAQSGDLTFTTLASSGTQTKNYSPTSVAIAQGFGTPSAPALQADDNNFMPVNSQQVGSLFITDWTATTLIAEQPASVTALTVTWSGNFTANQMQSVFLWNYSSSVWSRIDYRQIGTVEQLISIPVTSPASYISGSGEIKARIYSERADNAASYNDLVRFTVQTNGSPPTDTTPPQLTNIQAGGITSSAAVISWTTDENSDTQVEYGTTISYGASSALASSPTLSHSASLSGLVGNTLYHYRVKSRDAAGNLSVSTDRTFTTLNPVTSRDYFASALQMISGASFNNTGNINTDDSAYMTVGGVQSGGQFVTDWYAKTQLSEPRSQVKAFTITYNGRYSQNCDQGVFLYNFVSGVWARIDYQPVSTTDKTVTFRTTDLASYLSASGEIRMRVQGARGTGNFTCYADMVKFTIELQ